MGVGFTLVSLFQEHIPCVNDGKTLEYRYKSHYTDVGATPDSSIVLDVWDDITMAHLASKNLVIDKLAWFDDSVSLVGDSTLITVIFEIFSFNRDQFFGLDDVKII